MDDKRKLLDAIKDRRRKRGDALLTAKGVRDRVQSIRTCKHPQKQRELLFTLLEDIAQTVEDKERECDLRVTLLTEDYRAECAELERRYNEKIDALAEAVKRPRRFTD